MKNSSLIASVFSGLGNRMRVLLSSELAAEQLDRSFTYFWEIERNFTADISELWEYDRRRVGVLRERLARLRGPVLTDYEGLADSGARRTVVVRGQQPIAVPAHGMSWQGKLRELRPESEIRSRIVEFCDASLAERRVVGVMVRAHKKTHHVTKETSPPEWFIQRMRQIQRNDPDIHFFLSCDDPSTQASIVSAVPNVMAQVKNSRYNSSGGVKDAVVDVYLLAACSQILGPHWSSFVEMSLALAGPGTGFETPVSSSNADLDVAPVGKAADLFTWG